MQEDPSKWTHAVCVGQKTQYTKSALPELIAESAQPHQNLSNLSFPTDIDKPFCKLYMEIRGI
jgi:hypothetical protein